MAFVDRVTNPRPAIGELDWGPKLDAYLAELEAELENIETGGVTAPYTLRGYIRPTQTATLPSDLPADALVIVPLNA